MKSPAFLPTSENSATPSRHFVPPSRKWKIFVSTVISGCLCGYYPCGITVSLHRVYSNESMPYHRLSDIIWPRSKSHLSISRTTWYSIQD